MYYIHFLQTNFVYKFITQFTITFANNLICKVLHKNLMLNFAFVYFNELEIKGCLAIILNNQQLKMEQKNDGEF